MFSINQNSYLAAILTMMAVSCAVGQSVGSGANGGNIKSLSDRADAIVVGTATNLTPDGGFDLSIARVVKGSVAPDALLRVSVQPNASTLTQPSDSLSVAKRPGLFFLSADRSHWILLPLFGGNAPFDELYLPARLDTTMVANNDAEYSERVLAEFDAGLDETTIQRYRFAFTSMAGVADSPRLRAMYERLASSSSPGLASAGLAGQVSMNNSLAVQRCETATNILSDPAALLDDIAAALKQAYRSTDPSGIAALARIASNSGIDRRLQRAAGFALRAIHTQSTLGALAALLDSSDQEIRYDAVFGLASFANNYPVQKADNVTNFGYITSQGDGQFVSEETRQNVPGREAFDADEQRYLLFWKQWWSQTQTALPQ